MKYILSLPIFKEKTNSIIENEKVIFGPLPFYGVGNTIYSIIEKEESYYKVLYNQDGTINPLMLPVAKKKKKNLELLKRDYCHDLSNCIDSKRELFLEYKNNNYIPKLSNKNYILSLIITTIITLIAIPYIFTTSIIGIIVSTISILTSYIINDIHKKDNSIKNNRKIYIINFEKLENELESLQTNTSNVALIEKTIKENKKLEIKGVKKLPEKSNPKIRTLNNPELMKVA